MEHVLDFMRAMTMEVVYFTVAIGLAIFGIIAVRSASSTERMKARLSYNEAERVRKHAITMTSISGTTQRIPPPANND